MDFNNNKNNKMKDFNNNKINNNSLKNRKKLPLLVTNPKFTSSLSLKIDF